MKNVFTRRPEPRTGCRPTHGLLEVETDISFLNSLLKLLWLFKKSTKIDSGFLRYHLKLLLSFCVPISVLPLVSSWSFFSCKMNAFIGI